LAATTSRKDADGRVDDAAVDVVVVAHAADGFAEGLANFTDQRQAEVVHVIEMPIETGGHDAGGFRHFAQAQTAETPPALHQAPGCIKQGVAGLLFLFGTGQHGACI
jgi:hypothetical protein